MADFERSGFELGREATIQFSDVFGSLPIGGVSDGIVDFDAALTAQVRNTGRFVDAQYPIGAWPAVGDYGAVLLDQLRGEQTDRALKAVNSDDPDHPDYQVLASSLDTRLVAVVNSAPRTEEHRATGQNGDEFHVGVTASGLEVYAQLPYFRGLNARGLLTSLHRIPNDGGVWPEGEQFRSSVVTQARTQSDVLKPISTDAIPNIDLSGRLAYVDKFGNVRLEVADIDDATDKLSSHGALSLKISGRAASLAVQAVSCLTDIEEGELGIYHNPTERQESGNRRNGIRPGYLELIRRVSDPNRGTNHAYNSLAGLISDDARGLDPRVWDETDIRIDT